MVDVIHLTFVVMQTDQVIHSSHNVFARKGALGFRNGETELLIEFVATDATEVITFVVEEAAVENALSAGYRGRVARTEFAVDLD